MLERLGREATGPIGKVAAAAAPSDASCEIRVSGNPEVRLPHVDDLHADAHVPCALTPVAQRISFKVSIIYFEGKIEIQGACKGGGM